MELKHSPLTWIPRNTMTDTMTPERFSTKPLCIGLSGDPIYEGDEVLVYPQAYAIMQQLSEDVYVVDTSKPLPVPDTPYAKGVVEWNPEMLWYQVRVNWACKAWSDPMPVSLAMGSYAFDRVIGEQV
jgi:hypothetical protein